MANKVSQMPFPRIFSLINKNNYDHTTLVILLPCTVMQRNVQYDVHSSNILLNQFLISMFDSFYFLIPINTKQNKGDEEQTSINSSYSNPTMYYYQSIQGLCHPQKFHISDQYQLSLHRSVTVCCYCLRRSTRYYCIQWMDNKVAT